MHWIAPSEKVTANAVLAERFSAACRLEFNWPPHA
jgi:hypothetical protein